MVGDVAQRLEELIREICASRDWEVEALAIYVGSAGEHVTFDLIKRYIEYQERESTGQDKLF